MIGLGCNTVRLLGYIIGSKCETVNFQIDTFLKIYKFRLFPLKEDREVLKRQKLPRPYKYKDEFK